jgi:hypothetical protein
LKRTLSSQWNIHTVIEKNYIVKSVTWVIDILGMYILGDESTCITAVIFAGKGHAGFTKF